MPYGVHFWAPVAAAQGLKLTDQVRPASWRDRVPPPPGLRLVWGQDATSTPWRTLDGFYLVRDDENPYAYVQVGEALLPCVAQAQGGHIDVACDVDVSGTLVVRENAWTGWRVWRDGQRVWVGRENGWLAVAAPAGRHTYAFRYVPWDAPLGMFFTFVGLLTAAAWWWPGLVRAFRNWLGLARAALGRRPRRRAP
jgi:hypothetical protein